METRKFGYKGRNSCRQKGEQGNIGMDKGHKFFSSGRCRGFSLLELMIVVSMIAIIAATTVLSVVRAREQTQRQNIINNLKKISAAKDQWAMERGKASSDTPQTTDLAPYFSGNVFPTPVASETYFIESVGAFPYADLAFPIENESRFTGVN